MLLIDVKRRRILYSGDLRVQGRKGSLVKRFMSASPPGSDVLLLEGTNLGTDKPWMSEDQIEVGFRNLVRGDPRPRVRRLVGPEIDRTVTPYRACLKTNRTFVIDLYTAEVLELLSEQANLPRPGWNQLKVVITSAFAQLYRAKGRDAFATRMADHGIPARQLNETPSRWVVMARKSLMRDYARQNVMPGPDDAWSWSMWRGYLDGEDGRAVSGSFAAGGARACQLHTSGHASPGDLAQAMRASCVVPIHGAAWDSHAEGFAGIRRLRDGKPMAI
ncbi:hypothetical protein ACVWXM_006246 [Bradyrhizobium sp. GM7.3]